MTLRRLRIAAEKIYRNESYSRSKRTREDSMRQPGSSGHVGRHEVADGAEGAAVDGLALDDSELDLGQVQP
jgi:hypothetical protein